MKTNFVLFASFLLITFGGCKKDKAEEEKDPITNNGLVSNTGCKSDFSRLSASNDQSCVHYSYDESNQKLNVTHENAGFNCCPGQLSCNISFSGDTIIFTEAESKAECYCQCLYDMEIQVENLSPSSYFLKFVEPYAANMAKLEFHINLLEQDTGTYCVTRDDYPWGIID